MTSERYADRAPTLLASPACRSLLLLAGALLSGCVIEHYDHYEHEYGTAWLRLRHDRCGGTWLPEPNEGYLREESI